MNRVKLGVDGNAGFALLGINLQEGEFEFVEVQQQETETLSQAEVRAARQAYWKLMDRLKTNLPFYFDASHPYGS